MQFGNPIVGQEELIRSAIKSKNFTSDPETGVSGWRIARDGSATFYNLTVGSDEYFIDENGNAVFNSVSATDILLDGTSLNDLFADRAKGVVAVVTLPNDTPVKVQGEQIFARIGIPDFDPTRQYKVGISARINMAGTASDYVQVTCRYAWDAQPNTTSAALWVCQEGGLSGTSDWVFTSSFTFGDSTPPGSQMNLVFTWDTNSDGGQFQGTDYTRVWVEDTGKIALVSSYDPSSDAPPVQQYTKTYTATGSDSFDQDGSDRNVPQCYQGYYSTNHGNQWSMIQFDDAQMRADLAGAVIDDVNVYLNNTFSYYNAGMTAVVGTHNRDVIAGDQSYGGSIIPDRTREDFNKGQSKWFDVPNSIGEDFRDGNARGLVLGQGPSTSHTYYGYFAGYSQSGPPKIQITYTK